MCTNNDDGFDDCDEKCLCVCVNVCMVKLTGQRMQHYLAYWQTDCPNQNIASSRTSYLEYYLNRCLDFPWMLALAELATVADTMDDVDFEVVGSMDHHCAVNTDIKQN